MVEKRATFTGLADGAVDLTGPIQEWFDSFEDLHVEAEELIDRGDFLVASVVVHGRVPGSRDSDQEMTLSRTNVYRQREGKTVEVREYLTREQALEAPGLRE